MKRQKINIVDKNNNLIGTKYRDEIDYSKDIYQTSGVWITNSRGEILLAQRKLTKDKDPGKWGPAAAGTLEEGETYESNAYKEAAEEIGLTGVPFKLGPLRYTDHPRKYFGQWYICKVDKPVEEFSLQEEEVEQLKWIPEDELMKDIKENPDNYVGPFLRDAELLMEYSRRLFPNNHSAL